MTLLTLRRRLVPLTGLALILSIAAAAPTTAQALPSSNDPVDAQTAAGFAGYLESLRGKARAQGVSDAT
ncbi:MAG: hypothetical protein KJ752_04960, partial [Alphaproteobacteria bacterium]|nr:hypothetical protein [Alphaproteobacteria bacterium]